METIHHRTGEKKILKFVASNFIAVAALNNIYIGDDGGIRAVQNVIRSDSLIGKEG